jgi:hypothetical protein
MAAQLGKTPWQLVLSKPTKVGGREEGADSRKTGTTLLSLHVKPSLPLSHPMVRSKSLTTLKGITQRLTTRR